RHGQRGRYSYVMADTDWLTEKRVESMSALFEAEHTDLARYRQTASKKLPPFQGGVAGLFGYGLGRAFGRVAAPATDEFKVPDQFTGTYPWLISFDNRENRAWVVATGFPDSEKSRRRERASDRLRFVLELLDSQSVGLQPAEVADALRSPIESPQFPLP